MNALGLLLLGSALHATVFALLGALFYLALRRASPAAGALAAASSLLIMAVVSAVVCSPWPVWWNIGGSPTLATADSSALQQVRTGQASSPVSIAAQDAAPPAGALSRPADSSGQPQEATSALLTEFFRAVATARMPQQQSSSGWPFWLAVGFLVSLCAGFLRLGLGVLAVSRLRARSRPIDDPALDEEVQLLRAELSCTRRVAVRETSELHSPATLGWRRPLLLLPFDWRDWSQAELRAILAHELAHVIRGDFLTGLVAQISVALHFYHPLAHWLARRMRLEQELAADAWGAALSGGGPTYLITLAQMALRHEDRVLAGPARAFLPSRGTLLTRIEMLRNNHVFRTQSLPVFIRAGMIGTLALLGLAVAGVRGPAEGTRSFAQTVDQGIGQAVSGNASSFDLSLLPAETKMMLAIHTAPLVARDEIKSLIRSMQPGPGLSSPFVIRLEETDRLMAFWESLPEAPGRPGAGPFIPPPSGLVIHSAKPQDWITALTKSFGSAQEFLVAGQKCFRLSTPPFGSWCGFTPDDRTLVLAGEDTLRDLITDRKGPAPRRAWDQAWDKAGKGHLIAAVETRWLRRRLAQATPPGAQHPVSTFGVTLESVAPLLEKAQAYVLSIDASQGLTADIRAVVSGDGDAKPVAETMQALVTLTRNMVEGLKNDSNAASMSAPLRNSLEIARSLLSQAKIETAANIVSMHVTKAAGIERANIAKQLARHDRRRRQGRHRAHHKASTT